MAIGNLQQLIPAIFTGPNGERLTPEQIAQRQEIAQSLIGRATDTSPDAGGWASVLTKGLLGYQSGAGQRAADNAIKSNAESSQASIASMLNGIGLAGGAGYSAPVAGGASPTSAVATDTTVSVPTGDMAGTIRQGLISRGLAPHLADAAILNFQDESGLNPGINEQNPIVAGSRGGYGLYQLTGPRRREYEAFATQRGVNPADVDSQLDFFMGELAGSEAAAGNKFLASPDTASAAQVLVNDFLRPAPEHRQSRSAKYGRVATTPQEAIAQVAPQVGADPSNFSNRWDAGAVSPEVAASVAQEQPSSQPEMVNSVVPQQPTGPSASLLAQNDMMLGGALSPSGSSPVAQALSGSFPAAPSMQGQQSQGGINPAIVAALSNPYASQQERQIAGMLLGQQMEQAQAQQQQAQQMAQRQATAQTLGINPALAGDPDAWKASIEQATRNRNTVTVGNTVYDANTGQPVIQGQGDPTLDIQNYEYARNNGYGGSFADYQQEVKRAGATNIDNRQMGAVPAGYQVQYDDQGRPVSMSPIPGSPAEIEAKIAADKASSMGAAQTLSDAQKSETMMDATKSVLDIMNSASTPVTGTLSRPYALYSGSPAGKVRSYVSTLQSGVALGAMQRLKEASSTGATGFGALSAPELNILISDIGALDPDNTSPEIFKKTVERIQNNAIRTAENIVKNVSPDRIKELGLQPFIDSFTAQGKAPTGTKTKTGVTWSVN